MDVVLYFRAPVRSLLNRLADSLKVTSIKFELFGAKAELTPEAAKGTLDEMLQEIVEPMNELSPDEVDLFLRIDTADGRLTVVDLIPDFEPESARHAQRRRLCDRKWIRPVEGGQWQPQKHPIVTRFGHLARKLNPRVSAQAR